MLHIIARPKDGPEVSVEHSSGPLMLGRIQVPGKPANDPNRLEWNDPFVSGKHIILTELPNKKLLFHNVSQVNSARLMDDKLIGPNTKCELTLLSPPLSLTFTIGETLVSVNTVEDPFSSTLMASLAAPDSPLLKLADIQSDKANSAERLAGCLNAIINLQRSAATSREFFGLTAKALVEQIGLNRGLVLLKRKNRWMVEARFPDIEYEGSGREFSTSVLARLEEDRKTYFSDSTSINSFESLVSVKAVVASPILDQKGMITGAIYGIRDKGSSGSEVVIGSLEAQMVQLLASTVAVGMARLETAANFEAFFGLELALELEKNPALLAGQEREISVLFADIRGFSRLSQMLGPIETCKLVSDIMERLSKCVRDQQGVIVSYMGDGIIAMWNAPQEQPDHALRAVRAGMAMITCLGETNNTWSGKVGNLRVGVGVSSGPALCGNTGSSFKFQYGPLGNTVNVASRVEGATKHFGVNMLLTGTTKAHLPDLLPMRRIRKVRLVGIPEPVELYEVSTPGSISESLEFRTQYEQALKHYEDGRHLEAVRTLQAILANHADPDGPTLALLIRAVAALGHVEQGSPIENMANK